MKENENTNLIGKINRLNDAVAYLKGKKIVKTQKEIAMQIEVDESNLSKALRGNENYITDTFLRRFADVFDFNPDWLIEENGEMLNNVSSQQIKKTIPLSNSKLIEKNNIKVVTLIPAKAQLGLKGTVFKEDFISKLETKVIETEDNWQGRYFDIEATGESMVNEEHPELSIYDGDELRVREIPRDMYINNKLHIHDWNEFTFFHHENGIFTKNVIEHNVDERKVLVHSYNKNKDEYPDEWISLNDCYIVCNVISVTRPRGFKKRIKKLNGTK